ncbi:LptF/LptG family permease [Acetobacter sp. TBRC 12305]|uniref:LptF/LptG family permease n=1 Tax=Acetobacter garciniae TaxID=2817435 RepID=A0A939KNL2_9PROT|nr:LptF/LptG family permease [Acetobacter garciniae]MBO1325825.1 LptF/LptG family permease [Acetobacter garciniae]MBX0345725.1 LptF/LptG family permease [Acetobacter garciniae]
MPKEPFLHRFSKALAPGTLDKYMLTQLLPPFVIALSVVMIALLLERLLVLLNLLAVGNSHLGVFLELVATLLPHYLGLAIPAALCVSVFSVIRRMSQNEEIDAINSVGISLLRIIRPYMQLGAALGVASFFLYGFVQPHARYEFRAAFYFASHAGWTPRLQSRMFGSPSADLTITAEEVTQGGSELHHVFIRDMTDHYERDITARRGHIRLAPDGSTVQIDLEHGTIVTDRPQDAPSITTFEHSTRFLTHASEVSPFRQRGDDERELTSPELVSRLVAHNPAISRPHMRSEVHFRLARSLTVPFIPMLAAALAIARKRQRGNIGLPLAFLIMVGFDHILQFGHSLVATRKASLLAIWGPAVIFILICATLLLYQSGMFSLIRARLRRHLPRPA